MPTPMKTLTINGVTYTVAPDPVAAATTTSDGLMTAAMVTKLNGIAAGATAVTVDSALSSTSTNPVQNKVIYDYLNELAQIIEAEY